MEILRKNKDFNPHECGVVNFLNLVGGKWKVLIIFGISNRLFNSAYKMQKGYFEILK